MLWENIMSCIARQTVCKESATAAEQQDSWLCPTVNPTYVIQAFPLSMHETLSLSLVTVLSCWLHTASRLQGPLQQDGLWQPLLLSLLHYIVYICRCSICNLVCCVDAGRGIQGRSGSQRGQVAQLQLGYHCRCGKPGVADG